MKNRRSLQEILDYASDRVCFELNDVFTRDGIGETPLNVIATSGIVEDAETLLNAGSDINNIGDCNYTPQCEAVLMDHLEMVIFLLKNGADPQIKTDEGTALDIARIGKNQAIIDVLEQYNNGISTPPNE